MTIARSEYLLSCYEKVFEIKKTPTHCYVMDFLAAEATCGGEHGAAGAAASKEPDNPASISQRRFDCLFVGKQRQTM